MKNKKIFMILLSSLLTTSCITNTSNSNVESTTTSSINSSSLITQSNIPASSTTVSSISNSENEVKIKKIVANALDEDNNTQSISKKEKNKHEDEINCIIIYKSQTDIQFTIKLDNPEAYGIDALRVKCDDENAQIQVDGEWKPIAFEDDGTRVVNWSSEDPYEKTYNIRTTSDDAMNIFEVIDIRLAGHSKFQSKETKNTDIGNSELQIHKMDEDAYRVDVIENTFEYIKFKLAVKESYKNIIHNITVDGENADSEGIYTLYENKNIKVKYDYKINDELMVNRSNNERIERLRANGYLSDTFNQVMNIQKLDEYIFMADIPMEFRENNKLLEIVTLPLIGTGYYYGITPDAIIINDVIYDKFEVVDNISKDSYEFSEYNVPGTDIVIFNRYMHCNVIVLNADDILLPEIIEYNNRDDIDESDPLIEFAKSIRYVYSNKTYKLDIVVGKSYNSKKGIYTAFPMYKDVLEVSL